MARDPRKRAVDDGAVTGDGFRDSIEFRDTAEQTVACSVCSEARLWNRGDGTLWCPTCRVILNSRGTPR